MSAWQRLIQRFTAQGANAVVEHRAPMYVPPDKQLSLHDLSFTIFDTETSGLDQTKHHIVQIASMRIEALALDLGSAYSALTNTQGAVQPDSRLIHEIRPEEQRLGYTEAHVLHGFLEAASQSVLMAYDADFDLAFLRRAFKRHAWHHVEPVCLDLTRLASLVLPDWRGQAKGLDDCLRYCGIDPQDQDRHDALGDTFLAASLALVLLKKAQQQGWHTLSELQSALRHHQQLRQGANLGF